MKKHDLVYVAKFGRAIGLKGYLKLIIESDFPEQFSQKNISFYLEDLSTVIIEDYNKNQSSVKIQNISTPEDAKKYTNKSLFTTEEETRKNCKLKDDEFFWFELEGLEVFEDNVKVGLVKEVLRFSNMTYLSVLSDKALTDKKLSAEFLIPYILDDYIEKVDTKNKKILVKKAMLLLENS